MKKTLTLLFTVVCLINCLNAQVSGNIVHNNSNNVYASNQSGFSLSGNVVSTDINLLYHAKILGYRAVFGISEIDKTVDGCSNKVEAKINGFKQAAKKIGISENDIYVDAITQTRVYEFQLNDAKDVAKEELAGFEIKKNIIISFTKDAQLDQIMRLAAQNEIYDLIKVDYLIEEQSDILEKLWMEAEQAVVKKQALLKKVLGKKEVTAPKLSNFNFRIVHPNQSYQSFTANITNDVTTSYNYSSLAKVTARKPATFYYNGELETNYDKVIYGNENKLMPTVQFIVNYKFSFEAI